MKFVKITLSVALLGLLSIASAEDTTTGSADPQNDASTNTNISIDTQIKEIQSASKQERVQLMNAFKQRLMQMNQEDRTAAMQELQTKMHAQADRGHEFGTETSEMAKEMMSDKEQRTAKMAQTREQEHVQEMQMQTNEHMNQIQNMTQKQAGDQHMEMPNGGIDGGQRNMNNDLGNRR